MSHFDIVTARPIGKGVRQVAGESTFSLLARMSAIIARKRHSDPVGKRRRDMIRCDLIAYLICKRSGDRWGATRALREAMNINRMLNAATPRAAWEE